MFTKITTTFASLFVLACAPLAQDEGAVQWVDAENQMIAIQIRETTHAVEAARVKLLDAEGNPAKLADFAAGNTVKVSWDGDKISTIQKNAQSAGLAGEPGDKGSVVAIDAENQTMELKVGETNHSVAAADVTLLNAAGDPAKLEDFAAGDPVQVTFDGDKITTIQKDAQSAGLAAAPPGDATPGDATPGDEGSVVGIDAENQTMELKVGETNHSVAAADVKLLNAAGDPAKLEDFAAGDPVLVTFDGDKITAIQKKG